MSACKTIFRADLFEGKVALVTGGGSGIGLRTAKELALLGATVVIASRTVKKLEEAAVAIRATCAPRPCVVHVLQLNVRDPKSIEACVDETIKKCGGIDMLINNAGGQFPAPAEDISHKGWRAVLETNLDGPFFMAQTVYKKAFVPSGKGGAIVNVIANMWNGFPRMSHTGAARSAIDNLTKTLAIEWASNGVRVNSVAPGVIDSSGLTKYGPEFREAVIGQGHKFIYTWRFGTEEEVAASIIFLLTPAAAHITGVSLRVDGGESIFSPLWMPTEHNKMPAWKDTPLQAKL